MRTIITALATLFIAFTALPAHATDLDIPDLGLRISHFPDPLRQPLILKRQHGWGASVQNQAVVVDLYRQDEVLSPAVSVSDTKYQSTLLTSFERGRTAEDAQFRAGKIDGQDAVISVGAGRVRALVHFYCHIYLIADHHLVRMTVDSLQYSSGTVQRPAEFDQSVRALLAATFGPVTHPSADNAPPATAKILPPHLVLTGIPYPEHALRVGDEGVVDVEFSVDAKGIAQSYRQTYTDLPGLGKDIPIFLATTIFWLPADWDPSEVVSMEFRYSWVGSTGDQCPVKPLHAEVSSVMTICCARGESRISTQLFQCHEDLVFR